MRKRAVVHAMLLRAATAGEIEVFVQQQAVIEDELDPESQLHRPRSEPNTHARGHKRWNWALPSVEAERAEDLLIQTGTWQVGQGFLRSCLD